MGDIRDIRKANRKPNPKQEALLSFKLQRSRNAALDFATAAFDFRDAGLKLYAAREAYENAVGAGLKSDENASILKLKLELDRCQREFNKTETAYKNTLLKMEDASKELVESMKKVSSHKTKNFKAPMD